MRLKTRHASTWQGGRFVTGCSEQLTFSFHLSKQVTADFLGGAISSDAGLLPLRELDDRLGWTTRIAEILGDGRQAGKVDHPILSLVRQRLFALAAGYEDANDHTRLRHDPILKTVAGRGLEDTLGSQPTVSRLENAVTARQAAQLNRFLIEQFIQIHRRRRPREVVLDIDPTDDPCHGHQQLALFNGFYDQYMYLPALVFDRASGMLLGVRLQRGNASAAGRVAQILGPIVDRLRRQWPKLPIVIRADAAFGTPVLYRFCERRRLTYLVGLSATKPLKRKTDWAVAWLTGRFQRDGEPVRHRGGFTHQAGTWDHPRRVLYKVEVNDQGLNRRFVVTNAQGAPAQLWPRYDDRGTAETYIDDLKNGLAMDRLSCHRFVANAFRLVLTAVAYNLLRVFRSLLTDTQLAAASIHVFAAPRPASRG